MYKYCVRNKLTVYDFFLYKQLFFNWLADFLNTVYGCLKTTVTVMKTYSLFYAHAPL